MKGHLLEKASVFNRHCRDILKIIFAFLDVVYTKFSDGVKCFDVYELHNEFMFTVTNALLMQ